MKWIHQYFVTDFAEMTNISGEIAPNLNRSVRLQRLKWYIVIIQKMEPVNGCSVSGMVQVHWLKLF